MLLYPCTAHPHAPNCSPSWCPQEPGDNYLLHGDLTWPWSSWVPQHEIYKLEAQTLACLDGTFPSYQTMPCCISVCYALMLILLMAALLWNASPVSSSPLGSVLVFFYDVRHLPSWTKWREEWGVMPCYCLWIIHALFPWALTKYALSAHTRPDDGDTEITQITTLMECHLWLP